MIMRKIYFLLIAMSIGTFAIGQNLRFSYSVSNPDPANNQSKLTVFVQKVGGGSENFSGFNYGFYYKSSEATLQGLAPGFTSNNMTPAQLALCVNNTPAVDLGWAPDMTGSVVVVSVPPAGVPAGYDRLFTGAMVDGNGVGTDVTSAKIPIIALTLDNTVGGAPIASDSAYLGASDTNPAWAYSDINFNEFPIVAAGVRLQTLPIELIFFKAEKANDRSSHLTWSTASEINSSHFLVQRSLDKKSWNTAGKVNAAGNSQIIANYDLTDVNVYNGVDSRLKVYYRLQMFDLDGRSKFSPIETVTFGNDAAKTSSMTIAVYPNPATDGIHVTWDAQNELQPTSLELYDVTGKLVLTQKVSDNTNQEYIDFGPAKMDAGVYLVRALNGTDPIDHQQIVVGHGK